MDAYIAIDPGGANHPSGLAMALRVPGGKSAGFQILTWLAVTTGDQQIAQDVLTNALCPFTANPGIEVGAVIETWTNPHFEVAKQSLAANRSMWRSALCAVSIGPRAQHLVNSSTWQGACGLLGRMARVMGDTKAGSIVLASDIVGGRIHIDQADAADAIVMLDWWLKAGGEQGQAVREAAARDRKAARKSGGSGAQWAAFAKERGLA